MTYGKRTLIAVDQLLNTLLGGWPDETMSSWAYRLTVEGTMWPMRCIDAVAGSSGAGCNTRRLCN